MSVSIIEEAPTPFFPNRLDFAILELVRVVNLPEDVLSLSDYQKVYAAISIVDNGLQRLADQMGFDRVIKDLFLHSFYNRTTTIVGALDMIIAEQDLHLELPDTVPVIDQLKQLTDYLPKLIRRVKDAQKNANIFRYSLPDLVIQNKLPNSNYKINIINLIDPTLKFDFKWPLLIADLIVEEFAVHNPHKYSADQIKVSIHMQDEHIVFQISDNGKGIAEDDILKLNALEAGYRVESLVMGSATGTKTLKLLKIPYEFSSEGLGYGTTLTMHLPLREPLQLLAKNPPHPSEQPEG